MEQQLEALVERMDLRAKELADKLHGIAVQIGIANAAIGSLVDLIKRAADADESASRSP